MAETFTDNLKLSKRDTGDLNWGAGANANLDIVDGNAQLKNLRPPRTLLASLGSGGVGSNLLGNTTYFYKITAINELGETTENKIPVVTEAQITESASPVPIILSWETVPGATGYKIYKGTSANAELFLTQVTGQSTATFTDTGNTATQAGQNVPTNNTALLSVTGVRKIGQAAPLRGDVKLEAGPNVILTQDAAANKITIEASSGGVTTLRKEGQGSGLTGDVKLRAGTNIALTQDAPGNAIEIAATGGGGVTSLRKFGDPTGLTGDVKIDQGSDITVTQDVPNNKIIVTYSGIKGYATVIAPVPNGTNDTVNLQAALDAIPSGVGGIVILREGLYFVDTLNILREGTRLVGSGSGKNFLDTTGGTRIRSSGFSGHILMVKTRNVLIENIGFEGLQVPDSFALIAGDPNIQINNLEIKDCSFKNIRASSDGIRLPLAYYTRIIDCDFSMIEIAQQAASKTPVGIKIGPTTFAIALSQVLISGCMVRTSYPAPTSGTITAKFIELNKVDPSIVVNCRAENVASGAGRTFTFLELKQDASIGRCAVVKGNTVQNFHNFIKQTGAFPKVVLNGNICTSPQLEPAIDLVSGNTGWTIIGNVIEGTTGINLQTGADNNVVVGNVANVANAGTGNAVANNVAP